jgi:general secretion pathway protein H
VRGDRRGFTLLELAVVMLVLALAAALAAPSAWRGVEAIQLRAEVAGVASFLRAARERAVARRDALEVAADADGRALVLRAGGGGAVQSVRRLAPALRITAEPPLGPAVAFLAYGASTGGQFRLEAPGPVVYTVTVDPLTGRVTARRTES